MGDSNNDDSTNESEPQGSGLPGNTVGTPGAAHSFATITTELAGASKRMQAIAWVFIALAAVGGIGAIIVVFINTTHALEEILAAPGDRIAFVFFFSLVRSGSFAGLCAGFVWVMFALGRQALDQSVRYEKRLMAAHFMNFVMVRYDDQLRTSKVRINDVTSFLDAWSGTVESAFSKGRIPPKTESENFSLKVGKFEVAGPSQQPPPSPAAK